MNIHISNLSLNVTESVLRKLFSAYGEVNSAAIIKDKLSGRSRGTGFVEMPIDAEGEHAIEMLHRKLVDGKNISVNKEKSYLQPGW